MVRFSPMGVHVEVTKNSNESNASLIRRFTKRVQGAGAVSRVRGLRYHTRPTTKFGRKKSALRRLEKRAVYQELDKMGRLPVNDKKRRR